MKPSLPSLLRAERVAAFLFITVTMFWVVSPFNNSGPKTPADFALRGVCLVWMWAALRWRDQTRNGLDAIASLNKPAPSGAEEKEAPPVAAKDEKVFVVDPMDVSHVLSNFVLERNLPPGSYTATATVRNDGSAVVTVKTRRPIVVTTPVRKSSEQKPN